MIRAVIDTNILVSGSIKRGSPPARVLQAWRKGRFILVTSESILNEVSRVLNYRKIKAKYYLKKKDIEELLFALYLGSDLTPDRLKVQVITQDPEDNKFISCALEGHADYIVTGDEHLLKIKEHKGIKMVTAHEFLKAIK